LEPDAIRFVVVALANLPRPVAAVGPRCPAGPMPEAGSIAECLSPAPLRSCQFLRDARARRRAAANAGTERIHNEGRRMEAFSGVGRSTWSEVSRGLPESHKGSRPPGKTGTCESSLCQAWMPLADPRPDRNLGGCHPNPDRNCRRSGRNLPDI